MQKLPVPGETQERGRSDTVFRKTVQTTPGYLTVPHTNLSLVEKVTFIEA